MAGNWGRGPFDHRNVDDLPRFAAFQGPCRAVCRDAVVQKKVKFAPGEVRQRRLRVLVGVLRRMSRAWGRWWAMRSESPLA